MSLDSPAITSFTFSLDSQADESSRISLTSGSRLSLSFGDSLSPNNDQHPQTSMLLPLNKSVSSTSLQLSNLRLASPQDKPCRISIGTTFAGYGWKDNSRPNSMSFKGMEKSIKSVSCEDLDVRDDRLANILNVAPNRYYFDSEENLIKRVGGEHLEGINPQDEPASSSFVLTFQQKIREPPHQVYTLRIEETPNNSPQFIVPELLESPICKHRDATYTSSSSSKQSTFSDRSSLLLTKSTRLTNWTEVLKNFPYLLDSSGKIRRGSLLEAYPWLHSSLGLEQSNFSVSQICRSGLEHHHIEQYLVDADRLPFKEHPFVRNKALVHSFNRLLHYQHSDVKLILAFVKCLLYVASRNEIYYQSNTLPEAVLEQLKEERKRLRNAAAVWIENLSKERIAEACYIKGKFFEYGWPERRPNRSKALKWYLLASKLNYALAFGKIGDYYLRKGEFEKAVVFYRKGMSLSDPASLYMFALALIHGDLGLTKSLSGGFKFIKRSAKLSTREFSEGCFLYASLLGNLHPTIHIPKQHHRPSEAFKWLLNGAMLGHITCQRVLGEVYEIGRLGITPNPSLSIAWYCRAAEAGDGKSALAMSIWSNRGVPHVFAKNNNLAIEWCEFAIACSDLPAAHYLLGQYYEFGVGTIPDLEKAQVWYRRAADLGFQPSSSGNIYSERFMMADHQSTSSRFNFWKKPFKMGGRE